MSDFLTQINKIKGRLPALAKRLPGIAKVEGLRFIANNFKKEGFEKAPGKFKNWKKTKATKSKQILVGEKRGGALKRSWAQNTTTGPGKVEFTSPLVQAAVHNEGLKAGRGPGFKMPMRQMIGPSQALDINIKKKVDTLADQVFK